MGFLKKIFKPKKSLIFSDFEEHALMTCKTVSELKEAINLFCLNKDIKEIVRRILKYEKDDDEIKTKLQLKLYSGELLPYTSEDWFELSETIDDIADTAERVARLINIKKIKISLNLRKEMLDLVENAYSTVVALKDCIACLRSDLQKAGEKAAIVERRREITREKEYKLLSKIFNLKLKQNDLILLDLIIRNIAKIANYAESASDRIAAMALKYTF